MGSRRSSQLSGITIGSSTARSVTLWLLAHTLTACQLSRTAAAVVRPVSASSGNLNTTYRRRRTRRLRRISILLRTYGMYSSCEVRLFAPFGQVLPYTHAHTHAEAQLGTHGPKPSRCVDRRRRVLKTFFPLFLSFDGHLRSTALWFL